MQNTITFNNLSAVQIAAIGYILRSSEEDITWILDNPLTPAAKAPDRAPAPQETEAPAPTGKKRGKPTPAPAPEVAPPAEAEQEPPAAQESATDDTVYTLEEVRAALAGLSKSGKAPVAKQLISAAGADKLTDVDPSKYAQIMAAVAQEVA